MSIDTAELPAEVTESTLSPVDKGRKDFKERMAKRELDAKETGGRFSTRANFLKRKTPEIMDGDKVNPKKLDELTERSQQEFVDNALKAAQLEPNMATLKELATTLTEDEFNQTMEKMRDTLKVDIKRGTYDPEQTANAQKWLRVLNVDAHKEAYKLANNKDIANVDAKDPSIWEIVKDIDKKNLLKTTAGALSKYVRTFHPIRFAKQIGTAIIKKPGEMVQLANAMRKGEMDSMEAAGVLFSTVESTAVLVSGMPGGAAAKAGLNAVGMLAINQMADSWVHRKETARKKQFVENKQNGIADTEDKLLEDLFKHATERKIANNRLARFAKGMAIGSSMVAIGVGVEHAVDASMADFIAQGGTLNEWLQNLPQRGTEAATKVAEDVKEASGINAVGRKVEEIQAFLSGGDSSQPSTVSPRIDGINAMSFGSPSASEGSPTLASFYDSSILDVKGKIEPFAASVKESFSKWNFAEMDPLKKLTDIKVGDTVDAITPNIPPEEMKVHFEKLAQKAVEESGIKLAKYEGTPLQAELATFMENAPKMNEVIRNMSLGELDRKMSELALGGSNELSPFKDNVIRLYVAAQKNDDFGQDMKKVIDAVLAGKVEVDSEQPPLTIRPMVFSQTSEPEVMVKGMSWTAEDGVQQVISPELEKATKTAVSALEGNATVKYYIDDIIARRTTDTESVVNSILQRQVPGITFADMNPAQQAELGAKVAKIAQEQFSESTAKTLKLLEVSNPPLYQEMLTKTPAEMAAIVKDIEQIDPAKLQAVIDAERANPGVGGKKVVTSWYLKNPLAPDKDIGIMQRNEKYLGFAGGILNDVDASLANIATDPELENAVATITKGTTTVAAAPAAVIPPAASVPAINPDLPLPGDAFPVESPVPATPATASVIPPLSPEAITTLDRIGRIATRAKDALLANPLIQQYVNTSFNEHLGNIQNIVNNVLDQGNHPDRLQIHNFTPEQMFAFNDQLRLVLGDKFAEGLDQSLRRIETDNPTLFAEMIQKSPADLVGIVQEIAKLSPQALQELANAQAQQLDLSTFMDGRPYPQEYKDIVLKNERYIGFMNSVAREFQTRIVAIPQDVEFRNGVANIANGVLDNADRLINDTLQPYKNPFERSPLESGAILPDIRPEMAEAIGRQVVHSIKEAAPVAQDMFNKLLNDPDFQEVYFNQSNEQLVSKLNEAAYKGLLSLGFKEADLTTEAYKRYWDQFVNETIRDSGVTDIAKYIDKTHPIGSKVDKMLMEFPRLVEYFKTKSPYELHLAIQNAITAPGTGGPDSAIVGVFGQDALDLYGKAYYDNEVREDLRKILTTWTKRLRGLVESEVRVQPGTLASPDAVVAGAQPGAQIEAPVPVAPETQTPASTIPQAPGQSNPDTIFQPETVVAGAQPGAQLEQAVQPAPTIPEVQSSPVQSTTVAATATPGAMLETAPTNPVIVESTVATSATPGAMIENMPNPEINSKELIIPRGKTVSHFLVDCGFDVTWGPQDSKLFGAHIAQNYPMLTDMWGKMAESGYPGVKGEFPVKMEELKELIEKSEKGDAEAMQRLRKALYWIPAGGKISILSGDSAVNAVVKGLK